MNYADDVYFAGLTATPNSCAHRLWTDPGLAPERPKRHPHPHVYNLVLPNTPPTLLLGSRLCLFDFLPVTEWLFCCCSRFLIYLFIYYLCVCDMRKPLKSERKLWWFLASRTKDWSTQWRLYFSISLILGMQSKRLKHTVTVISLSLFLFKKENQWSISNGNKECSFDSMSCYLASW